MDLQPASTRSRVSKALLLVVPGGLAARPRPVHLLDGSRNSVLIPVAETNPWPLVHKDPLPAGAPTLTAEVTP